MNTQRLIFALKDSPSYVDGRNLTTDELPGIRNDTVVLTLENSKITDQDIDALPELHSLKCLDLDSTSVSDQALNRISQFPALEELWLEGTDISDEGLRELFSCNSLRFVSVAYTRVTEGGAKALRSALIGLEVSV